MADSTALRERNRRRRNKRKGFQLKYAAYAAFVASVGLMIAGWIAALALLWLIAGCVLFAAAAVMLPLSVKTFIRAAKKSPEYKAARWDLIFYSLFVVMGVLLIVFGIVNP
ncbi:hypothetical protein FACS1894211_16920 [Clostridia bacterium]|nr:hypothetical protein FACS1894211_16920 [Clostridia bacterium]